MFMTFIRKSLKVLMSGFMFIFGVDSNDYDPNDVVI